MELAAFGASCFWGVEAAFRKVKGVTSTSVGYMGGHFPNPSYVGYPCFWLAIYPTNWNLNFTALSRFGDIGSIVEEAAR